MATTKTRKSASKQVPGVRRGSASKRPGRKKGRASDTLHRLGKRASAANDVARVSMFATDALAVFTRGVRHQLAVLAKKQIPTAAIIDGRLVRGIPRKVGSRYVLDAPSKGTGGKHGAAKR
jgi:hypothetical protein